MVRLISDELDVTSKGYADEGGKGGGRGIFEGQDPGKPKSRDKDANVAICPNKEHQ
jgi:hypothetical protein